MRILLVCVLLLCCSISYGQTVLIDVPSPISPCACSPCDCVPLIPIAPKADVSVEVERTGVLTRLCTLRSKREGPRFLLKLRNRRKSDVEVEVEGFVVPPAPKISVSVRGF